MVDRNHYSDELLKDDERSTKQKELSDTFVLQNTVEQETFLLLENSETFTEKSDAQQNPSVSVVDLKPSRSVIDLDDFWDSDNGDCDEGCDF